MVCEKCKHLLFLTSLCFAFCCLLNRKIFIFVGEKKLSKVIVPDKWKDGASNTTEGGGRKINENKLLSKKQRLVRVSP